MPFPFLIMSIHIWRIYFIQHNIRMRTKGIGYVNYSALY